MVVTVSCCQLDISVGHLGRRNIMRTCLLYAGLEASLLDIFFFLVNNLCWRVEPTVGDATPGQMVLGGI